MHVEYQTFKTTLSINSIQTPSIHNLSWSYLPWLSIIIIIINGNLQGPPFSIRSSSRILSNSVVRLGRKKKKRKVKRVCVRAHLCVWEIFIRNIYLTSDSPFPSLPNSPLVSSSPHSSPPGPLRSDRSFHKSLSNRWPAHISHISSPFLSLPLFHLFHPVNPFTFHIRLHFKSSSQVRVLFLRLFPSLTRLTRLWRRRFRGRKTSTYSWVGWFVVCKSPLTCAPLICKLQKVLLQGEISIICRSAACCVLLACPSDTYPFSICPSVICRHRG